MIKALLVRAVAIIATASAANVVAAPLPHEEIEPIERPAPARPGRRRHLAKRKFVDPKTTVPRQSAPLVNNNPPDGEIQEIQEIQNYRYQPSLHKLPFHRAAKQCVKIRDIINISEFVRDLYREHRIRVFPRNGFLLGIVRHGGYLPVEAVDADLGVVYEDLASLSLTGRFLTAGDFRIRVDKTEGYWINWNGLEPASQQPYPFFGAMFMRDGERMHAYAAYPYRDTGGYIYPRLDKAGFNHGVHIRDALRYNEEGGDFRMVDTDERMNEGNIENGKQLANFFATDFSCMEEVQFYFTTIFIPCDYDSILTSQYQYGENWRRIERRGQRGGPKHPSRPLNEEENAEILEGGPRPICAE